MSRRHCPHQSKIGTRHGSIRLAVKKLEHEIEHAGNYDEYEAACLAHDALSGAEEWKAEDASDDYDYKLIRKRVQRLQLAGQRRFTCAYVDSARGATRQFRQYCQPVLLTQCKNRH